MATLASPQHDLTLNVTQTMRVEATIEDTFAALLEEMGQGMMTPEGAALLMVLEAFPGGRWYRDLGGDNGHLWGFVQAIKRPTLLEITGPLFMSSAVVSNLQYRLTTDGGATVITLAHRALGFIPEDQKAGMHAGWAALLDRVRQRAGGEGRRR